MKYSYLETRSRHVNTSFIIFLFLKVFLSHSQILSLHCWQLTGKEKKKGFVLYFDTNKQKYPSIRNDIFVNSVNI